MKIFLDRNKTLLPRVDSIYLLTRIMTLLGIVWYALVGEYPRQDSFLFYVIIGTFTIHLAIFYFAIRGKFDIKLAYLSAVFYDLLLVPLLILYTNGLQSSFYLLFFLTISVAAYVLRFWVATAVTFLVTLAYLGSIYRDLNMESGFDVSVRVGFLLVFYLALTYASEYLRRSEKRLLKLFDTLNKRTSELEKSQAHVEMIYENSRILASLLDTDSVVREVMRIMGALLQFPYCALILTDKWGSLYYQARSVTGRTNFHPKAVDANKMELARRVCDIGEPIHIKDIANRHDYLPLSEKARSIMLVPMTSHGQSIGVLAAESNNADQFTDRDVQMLSIVARSAALALENAELHKKTEGLTIIDELTEAYNYRYFIQKLQEEKRRALRYDLPLSLIMVDIDWFKKLNDTHGHEAGNLVLRHLSRIIKSCIRDVDIFARYGGEEFVVILPQTSQREAMILGERIRERVENTLIDSGKAEKLKITVSVGVSSFPENGKSQEELVSIADQALYRAKGEGRNLVCVI
jgi:diguanylate cyclase (GGDEF)-like protein